MLFVFAIPVVVFSTVFAPQIIQIISGAGYEPAAIPMRIVMPLILIIGYEQILILQVLMPLKKDKTIFINSCIGAAIGVLANILLVPKLNSIGSALVWVLSEFVVLILAQRCLSKFLNVKFPFKELSFHIALSLPCALSVAFIASFFENAITGLLLGFGFILTYYYVLYVHIMQDPFILSFIKSIRSKFSI